MPLTWYKCDLSSFLTLRWHHSDIAVENFHVFLRSRLGSIYYIGIGIISLQETRDLSRRRGNVTAAFVGISSLDELSLQRRALELTRRHNTWLCWWGSKNTAADQGGCLANRRASSIVAETVTSPWGQTPLEWSELIKRACCRWNVHIIDVP